MTKIDIKYTPITITEPQYKRGDCFIISEEGSDGELFMLVSTNSENLILVSLNTGNRWSNIPMRADFDGNTIYERTLYSHVGPHSIFTKVDSITISVK